MIGTPTENAVPQLLDQDIKKSSEDSIWFNKTGRIGSAKIHFIHVNI